MLLHLRSVLEIFDILHASIHAGPKDLVRGPTEGIVWSSIAIVRYKTCRRLFRQEISLVELCGQLNIIRGLTLFNSRYRIVVTT